MDRHVPLGDSPRKGPPATWWGSCGCRVAQVLHGCYGCSMSTVGLRELRQDASELVRRVENGEEIEITVSGRLAAKLVPVREAPRRWNQWDDIADVFNSAVDADWVEQRDLVDQTLVDPWGESA